MSRVLVVAPAAVKATLQQQRSAAKLKHVVLAMNQRFYSVGENITVSQFKLMYLVTQLCLPMKPRGVIAASDQ